MRVRRAFTVQLPDACKLMQNQISHMETILVNPNPSRTSSVLFAYPAAEQRGNEQGAMNIPGQRVISHASSTGSRSCPINTRETLLNQIIGFNGHCKSMRSPDFNDGKIILLRMFAAFRIFRHKLIAGNANLFDPFWNEYLVKRKLCRFVHWIFVYYRVVYSTFRKPEPDESKGSSPVLRGQGRGNPPELPTKTDDRTKIESKPLWKDRKTKYCQDF